MRIAEISAFTKYSVGKIMTDIKNVINLDGNNSCKIFFARETSNNPLEDIKFGNDNLVKVNGFFARFLDNDGFCSGIITKRLISELDRFKPDIIHLHCLHGYYLNVHLLFEYLNQNSNILIVWTMHDNWAVTGHCCFFSRVNCEKWKKGCYKCELKKDYPSSFFIDNSKKNYSLKKEIFTSISTSRMKVITPSNWLKNILKDSFLSKYEIRTIYNGINLDIFNKNRVNEANVSIPNKKIILGVASVWDERKGLSTFYSLAERLPEDWSIVLIGKGIVKNKLPKNIYNFDRTDNQKELVYLYQNANFLFNPTKDDNYPTVNLEAQACGCPVISFDVGGCKETDAGNLFIVNGLDSALEIILSEKKEKEVNYQKLSDKRMALEYYHLFLELYESKCKEKN